MDESKPSIPSDEISLRPASDWKSAVVDAPPVDLAKSDKLIALERQRHSDQSELCRNDLPNGPSVVVHCGNEEEVSRGFLIALRAMEVAVVEQPPEPAKPFCRASKGAKARVFHSLSLCVFLLAACGPNASPSPADAITFDTLKGLDDFEIATAGDGKPGEWSIIENDAGRVLAQMDTDPADNRFPLAIYRPFSGRDVYVSIRFMTISGETDQAAGVLVRFASVDDYYVARASALENSVSLYRVVAGKRETIGSMEVNVAGQAWHTLGIAARDERLTIFFDDRELFVATDRRFPGPAGKVGLWTKADSMTWFESLKIDSLD